ncbi:MAG: hypothetical protein QM759_08440 [Terricaulis sp.]
MKSAVSNATEPRLVTCPVAMHYLGGERPERFGVNPIQGKRQRLYDRRAIDAALDRMAGLARGDQEEDSPARELQNLVAEWR